MKNILAAHVDALNQGVDNAEWLLVQHTNGDPVRNAELAALLDLARQLKLVLVPVAPRPQFVTQLALELGEEIESPQKEQTHHWLWWGAAAGSVAAGILGFVFWRRGRVNKAATAV